MVHKLFSMGADLWGKIILNDSITVFIQVHMEITYQYIVNSKKLNNINPEAILHFDLQKEPS